MTYFYGDIEGIWMFEICATVPAQDKNRKYRENITVHVVAGDSDRAMTVFKEVYPDASIHKLERRNRTKNVLIDPEVLKPNEAQSERQ